MIAPQVHPRCSVQFARIWTLVSISCRSLECCIIPALAAARCKMPSALDSFLSNSFSWVTSIMKDLRLSLKMTCHDTTAGKSPPVLWPPLQALRWPSSVLSRLLHCTEWQNWQHHAVSQHRIGYSSEVRRKRSCQAMLRCPSHKQWVSCSARSFFSSTWHFFLARSTFCFARSWISWPPRNSAGLGQLSYTCTRHLL